jgi:uncharacterized protein YciI
MPKWDDYDDYKAEAKSRGALAMELFVVQTRPAGDMDLVKAHLAYQKRMEQAGSLFLAGPVSDDTGEMMQAEGMIIYRAADLSEARALADADPMHANGARTYQIRKWLINEGKLNFSVALSSQSIEVS